MSLKNWLQKSLELAQKKEAEIQNDIKECLQLKPVREIDLKKYLSISVEERMAQHSELVDKIVDINMDIIKLLNLIAREEMK